MFKKILRILLVAALAVAFGFLLFTDFGTSDTQSEKLRIVASNFPGYDFARTIAGEYANIELLVAPGSDIHSYSPSPQDIIKIKESDLFIYTGGESDTWIDEILKDNQIKTLKMLDIIDALEEESVEGMETEEEEGAEYDEHVWTSLKNAITITQSIADALDEINPEHKNFYDQSASTYSIKLHDLDAEYADMVARAKRKEIIVADRFPFRYLVEDYGLDYYAAFPGCAEQSEASASTITFLVNKIKNDQIPVILTIELSNQNLAKTIAKETSAEILTLHSAHNPSKEDFETGLSYFDFAKQNLETLRKALN